MTNEDWPEWRGPYIKVPWSIMDDPTLQTPRALARWFRQQVEEQRAKRRRRRAYINPAVWRPILVAFGYRCAYCGASGVPLERDHRMPVHRGGTDHPSNLVPACKPCNIRKGTDHPDDWPILVPVG